MKDFLRTKEATLLMMIIVISIVISFVNPTFLRLDNFMDLMKNSCVFGILACGMLLVILTGGIDVSVGAITAACACIMGTFLVYISDNILLACIVSIGSGALMGLINGLLIAHLSIPAIVATLGMYNVLHGFVKYLTNGTWINNLPENFLDFGKITFFNVEVENVSKLVGIPMQVLFLAGAAVLTWWLLKYTIFGRGVYSLGGNRVSAERIGYNIKKTETLLYTYLGALAGVAAVVHASIFRQIDPNTFTGFEIHVIAIVVIGGTNIMGGYGSVFGTLLGLAFMQILNNALILMRIPTFWQQIVIGTIIVIAVSIDALSRYNREKLRMRVDVDTSAFSFSRDS